MKSPLTARVLTGALVACLSAVALVGCANPVEKLIESGAEKLIEQGTGGNVSIDSSEGGISFSDGDGNEVTFGAGAEVPAEWPGLPLPDGELIGSTITGEAIGLSYNTTQVEVDALVEKLERDGFEVDQSMTLDVAETRIFKKGDAGASLQWTKEDDGRVTLMYFAD